MKALLGLKVFALVILLNSCSSLFYYPTHVVHFPPEMIHAQPEDKWIDLADGTKVHGWYFTNLTKKKARTLVVHFHGNSANISSHYLNFYWMLNNPVDYFVFDYRGYGRSEFSSRDEKITRKSTVEDGVAVLEWAIERATKNKQKLVVVGQSLGGAVAPQSIYRLKDKSKIDLLLLDSTFHSYQEVGRKVMASRFYSWLFQPLAYAVLDDEYAPKDVLASMRPFKTIVSHGDGDPVVNYSLGLKVYSYLKEPKEFWRIPGGQHTDIFWGHNGVYRQKFLRLIGEVEHTQWKEGDPLNPDFSFSYQLPYLAGKKQQILQGESGGYSHKGAQRFAIDFKMDVGSAVHAARAGRVEKIEESFGPGGDNESFRNKANFVQVRHDDGTLAEYVHLKKDSVFVKPGQYVKQGDFLGLVGMSGYTSKAHLHFMLFYQDKKGLKQSLPAVFNTQDGPATKLKQHSFYRQP
ncbi:alpha/beta fold hydrolase [bacterium]|nr:alpha/beta fold hydrolase [bacterium]